METKEKLREKLRKKREARKNNVPPFPFTGDSTENPDIFKMIENVNKILKTNPQMVQQISKCVSNVMNNKDLMESLAGQLESELKVHDQTLQSNSEGESLVASEKDSTQ